MSLQKTLHILYRRAVPGDYKELIALQNANLMVNLKEHETRDGFLSIQFSEQQFDEINRDLAVVVAVKEEAIVGYLCANSFAYGRQFSILKVLIRNVDGRVLQGVRLCEANCFIYGPVCVAKIARGSGVLAGLFTAMKEIARQRYAHCVLFVSEENPRSLRAHTKKLAMTGLGVFDFDQKRFHILGAPVHHSYSIYNE